MLTDRLDSSLVKLIRHRKSIRRSKHEIGVFDVDESTRFARVKSTRH